MTLNEDIKHIARTMFSSEYATTSGTGILLNKKCLLEFRYLIEEYFENKQYHAQLYSPE